MRRSLAIVLMMTASVVHAAPSASTKEAKPEAKKEAKERFDRGLRLFDEGDKAGALAELQKAFALVPSPIVLYDLALVHASMGHAVEAVDALEKLSGDSTGLSPSELAHAKKLLAEQSARVGEIEVVCDVPGAHVELDNLEVASTPLEKPLRVSAGTHVVGLFATGRIPSRKAVTVAGRARETASFVLAPLVVASAQLTIGTHLREVDVLANGVLLGRTPFASTLALEPGTYAIELRRPGYHTIKTTIVLAAGGSGAIALEPEEDPSALAGIGGRLELVISETGASVAIDGRSRGVVQSLSVPPGAHRIRVERSGFVAEERDVVIDTGKTARVRVVLEPTSDFRLSYERSARVQRTWAWSLIASGLFVAGTGTGFLVWNAGKKAAADDAYEHILFESEPGAGRSCDPRSAAPSSCRLELDARYDTYRATHARDLYGWIGVSVGAVAAATGVFVLLRADDPARYVTTGFVVPGGGGLSLSGLF